MVMDPKTMRPVSSGVAPSVTLHPTGQVEESGSTATFSADASGDPSPTVQWQLSTDGGSNWSDISGATATSYTTSTLLPSDDQNHTTNAATLTVDYFFEAEWLEVGADAFNPTDLLLN